MFNNAGIQMPKSRLKVIGKTAEELKILLRKDEKYMIGVRLYAVYQISLGYSSRQLENLYNVSFKSVCNWINGFNKFGLEGLKDKPRSGRKPRLTMSEREEIRNIVREEEPITYGYNTTTWTGPLLIDFIKKKYGILYKKAQIYNILKGMKLSYKRGLGIYPEADKEKRKLFNEALKKTPRKRL